MKRLIAAVLGVALLSGLIGCAPLASGLPDTNVVQLSDGSFALADSYEQILDRIVQDLPGADAARLLEEYNEVDSTDQVAGVDSLSKSVDNGRGFVYVAEAESLDVREESLSGEALQTINLYSCANVGGQAISVAYDVGTKTLAVLFVTEPLLHYTSSDYLLSAWCAPRSLVLFFDAGKDDELVFDKAIGISGSAKAVALRNGVLYVAASHRLSADIGVNGQWIVQGRSDAQVEGYAQSLALRGSAPEAFVPSFFSDDMLTPLRPSQIYLPKYGDLTISTVVGAFSLKDRSCTGTFAFYEPETAAGKDPETGAVGVDDAGLSFNYQVYYQDKPATITVFVPIGADGSLSGLGSVSFSAAAPLALQD